VWIQKKKSELVWIQNRKNGANGASGVNPGALRAKAGSGQKKCASGSAAIAQWAGSARWWNAPLALLAPFFAVLDPR